MATQLHDGMEYLTDAEGLLQSLRALVPHAVALAWTARALEYDAKKIHALFRSSHGDLDTARRLDVLSNRAIDIAGRLQTSGFFITLARRSLLKCAVLFTQSACLARGEDPASTPMLDPLWRSAVNSLSELFTVV